LESFQSDKDLIMDEFVTIRSVARTRVTHTYPPCHLVTLSLLQVKKGNIK